MQARDVMTTNPVTVTPRATLGEVWDLMREADIRHVPVVNAGALVGMLSDRDLAALDVAGVLTTEGADALRRRLARPVVTLMSSDVVSVEAEDDVAEVVDLMLEHKVGAVPVVRSGIQELVGIVSYIDVLRAVRELVGEE
jgi:acetoin utilization protein AcuB